MKVFILGFGKLAYMPYMNFYLENLKKNNCEIHLLYWDRDGNKDLPIPEGIIPYKFEFFQEDDIPKIKKIKSFIMYRKKAKKILKSHEFDMLIILHTIPGIILSDILFNKYAGKYILDYRDFTYENIKVYRSIIVKLVEKSIATFVSSDAYRKVLPKIDKIYTSHNISMNSLKFRSNRDNSARNNKSIKIRFWGFIRHESINKIIIDRLGNDERFELHYHGRIQSNARILVEYCKKNNFKNIYFHGEYLPKDRYIFSKDTDLIHNIYENDIKTQPAMGNKFYDAITFNIPQICNKDSFMGSIVSEFGVGVELSPYEFDFADKVYKYYLSIDWNKFNKDSDKYLKKILNEYSIAEILISNHIKKERVY